MAQPFPYTCYACDCFDSTVAPSQPRPAADEDERTFDPRSPRASYSLFPLDHLLYCEDCRQIRCPRCVTEETLNWFCPSCLFEVPSSVVKSDGNRCTRNCYNCPVCAAPMTVNSLEDAANPSPTGGPFILACGYCHWSTVEIDIEFEKHTAITAQLARIANGGRPIPAQKERDKERDRFKEQENSSLQQALSAPDHSPIAVEASDGAAATHEHTFSNLAAFYKAQVASQAPANPFSPHDVNFASPSSFSRIMNLYSSTSSKKHRREKPLPMREAASQLEGLTIHHPASDAAAIERIKKDGWTSTLSLSQKRSQPDPAVRFDDQLRPIATLLCTKRGKRCRSCRHILSKPESKITSTRYKIKLLALNHIPRLSIRALQLPSPASAPAVSSSASPPNQAFDYNSLRSGIPSHFLLHLSNPLFDPIRVTLATPSVTTGKIQSRITILAPQFEVGANTDVWDDALSSISPVKRGSLVGPDGQMQIEAGKIWDRGRNWTSVVLEIVPGFLKSVGSGSEAKEENELDEDDDVLEIPIFVRIEFEADVNAEERGLGDSRGSKGEKEKREEAFWVVVGVGRIAPI